MYDPLEPYRFPKRHDFVIQECRAIDVREVVCWFSKEQYHALGTVRLESGLLLFSKKCGAAQRWHFLCPSCNRPCEHLYLPPGEMGESHVAVEQPTYTTNLSASELAAGEQEGGWFATVARAIRREEAAARRRARGRTEIDASLPYTPVGNWRCRKCWNLNYASQHYGRTHPLRRQITRRRALTHRRRLAKANRARAKLFGVRDGELPAFSASTALGNSTRLCSAMSS